MANVPLHLALGLLLRWPLRGCSRESQTAAGSRSRRRRFLRSRRPSALRLVWVGNLREHRWVLNAHVASALLGVVALLPFLIRQGRVAGVRAR